MRKKLIFVGLLALILFGTRAHDGLSQPPAKEEPAIRKTAAAYIEAMNKGNLEAILAFWAADADFVDETGKKTRGHEALGELFKKTLPELKGSKITGQMHSLKFLRPDVALEDGSIEITAADGTRDSNRFAIVWVKSGDKWLISSARDLPTEIESVPSLPYLQLKSLEWLVGGWKNDGAKADVNVKCEWAPNKSFLLMHYEVRREGQEPTLVTQRVGWDPLNNRVRSWVFDSSGGFGEGYWTREGNKWVVGASGILPDGGTGTATNVYEFKDANSFIWRSVDREIDSQPVADIEANFVRKTAK
jgi:uncharacterized protein (TIGR02246 family)